MFVYQPTLSMLELKEDNNIEYIITWKSKGLFKSNLKPLLNLLQPTIKQFGYKVAIPLVNNSLTVENNNYLTKIVNVYIAYGLYS